MPEAVKRMSAVQKSYELLPQNENNVIVTKQPTESQPAPVLGYDEFKMNCQRCKREVTSVTRLHITDKTHMCVFCLSLVTWPLCVPFLAGLPYCLKWCQTVEHICPNCNATLGKYSKF